MRIARQLMCFVFASMVLFSSSFVMVGMHVCGGSVQNVALFSKAQGCGMEVQKKMPPCHRQESKPCCEDQTIIHESQTCNISTHEIAVPFAPFVDVVLPQVVIAEIVPSIESTIGYVDYDPPLRAPDLTVSLHVFLI